jgi:hypothetical protein
MEAKLLHISDLYPNFSGFYLNEGNTELHINATDDREIPGLASLIRSLFPSSVPDGDHYHVHIVRYSYSELNDMITSVGVVRVMQHPLFFSGFIDMVENRIVIWFHEGISDDDIQLLLDETEIPVDALQFRGGLAVTTDGPRVGRAEEP